MFGLVKALTKTVVDVATSPVEVVKDIATLGGVATGRSEPYTVTRAREVMEDAEDAFDELTS